MLLFEQICLSVHSIAVFTCSKFAIEALNRGVEYVQSEQ